MDSSIFLARVVGPLFLIIVLAVAVDRTRLTVAAREHLASPAMILLTAILLTIAGLAMVNAHNLWVADWRLAVTLVAWLTLAAGAVRLVAPRFVMRQGNGIMNRVWPMWAAAAVALGVGLLLTWQGYLA